MHRQPLTQRRHMPADTVSNGRRIEPTPFGERPWRLNKRPPIGPMPVVLAVLKAKIEINNLRIRASIGPKPTISFGKRQSGPSPGTPGPRTKFKK